MTDEKKSNLPERTKKFALSIVLMYTNLPKREEAFVLGKQLLRSGTSVGAHYREAYRARSAPEFISKIEVGIQELDESIYWLELLSAANLIPNNIFAALNKEAQELIAILVTIIKNVKAKQNSKSLIAKG